MSSVDWNAKDPNTVFLNNTVEGLKPLGNQVVVEIDSFPEKSEGGLWLAPDSRDHEHCTGTIIAVGPGKVASKTHIRYPMELEVGDKVLLGRYVGADFKYKEKTYRIMPEEQIYCVIEK